MLVQLGRNFNLCCNHYSLKIADAKGSSAKRQTGGNGCDYTYTHVPACISTSYERLPLLVIFSGKNTWSSWLPIKYHPDVYFSATMKGWKTAELFYDLFQDVFLPQVKEKTLLILDNLGSHLFLVLVELALEKNVTILKLPAHP